MQLNEILGFSRKEPNAKKEKNVRKLAPIAYNLNNMGFKIYKGFKGDPTFRMLPLKNRTSQNTSNIYTLLIDSNPYWVDYPKRDNSFICTNGKNYAQAHGNVYQLYPEGDPLIAICPEYDIWKSFPKLFKVIKITGMGAFNNVLTRLGRTVNIELNNMNSENLREELEYVLQQTEKHKLKLWRANTGTELGKLKHLFLVKFFKTKPKGKTNMEWLDYLMSPENNGFKLKKLSEIIKEGNINQYYNIGEFNRGSREIWFSAPAYFI